MLWEISEISVFNLNGAERSWEGRVSAIGTRSAQSGRVSLDPLFIDPHRVGVRNKPGAEERQRQEFVREFLILTGKKWKIGLTFKTAYRA
ncbi:uncharacterized [Tachysurus ichikawai]